MTKAPRTQAMRVLAARKIPFQVHTFPETIRDAVQVAASIGYPPAQVYKTLVVLREASGQADGPFPTDSAVPLLVMLPADQELDLRAFARAIGTRRARMATHDQAEQLTGLRVGGISALALLNRRFVVYIDKRALDHEEILVSGGQRGVDLQLRVADLIALTGAQAVEAALPKG